MAIDPSSNEEDRVRYYFTVPHIFDANPHFDILHAYFRASSFSCRFVLMAFKAPFAPDRRKVPFHRKRERLFGKWHHLVEQLWNNGKQESLFHSAWTMCFERVGVMRLMTVMTILKGQRKRQRGRSLQRLAKIELKIGTNISRHNFWTIVMMWILLSFWGRSYLLTCWFHSLDHSIKADFTTSKFPFWTRFWTTHFVIFKVNIWSGA